MHSMSRRTFVSGLVVGAGALALAACSSGTSGSDASTDATSQDDSTSGSDAGDATHGDPSDTKLTKPLDNGYDTGTHHATLEVEGYGAINLELDADMAPITVSNFADLANSGFYDGLTFHRIIKDFMIQGGDPNGDGTGGSSRRIKGEFATNGVANTILHNRGTISMARATDPDSASSQFFIVQKDAHSLDGQYAGFGKVTDDAGLAVVDAIAEVPVQDDNGTVATDDQPRITSLRMTD